MGEKYAASIPRKMFWSDKVPNKLRCPFCHSKLEKDYQTYMVAMRIQGEFETFVMGNDYGSFCPECPVVVLDRDGFGKTLAQSASGLEDSGVTSFEFTVMGIVDLDSIPDDKRHLILGDDDNPIPLVGFTETIESAGRQPDAQSKGKRLSGNQRRRLRKLRDATER